jgi:hypothetical protein
MKKIFNGWKMYMFLTTSTNILLITAFVLVFGGGENESR